MNYKIFELPIIINQKDIDENNHVNNISYLKWVQDIAMAHWNFVAPKNLKENLLWVVSRHEIDYLKSAYITDTLISKTWVIEPQGAKSDRYVEIINYNSNDVIAKIKTTWYLLDALTKKPKRIDASVSQLFH